MHRHIQDEDQLSVSIVEHAEVYKVSWFAERWYSDACRAATGVEQQRLDANRHEIIFSACCAESYLFEWTYTLLSSFKSIDAFKRIQDYFRIGSKRGLKDQWRVVPKKLLKNGFISREPDNSGNGWSAFIRMVDLRDGLVHAHLSRPYITRFDGEDVLGVTPEEIAAVRAGWASGVVAERIRALNEAAETETPSWVVDP